MAKKISAEQLKKAQEKRAHAIDFIERCYHPDYRRPEMTFGQIGEKWQYDYFIEPFFNPLIDRQYNEAGRDWDKTGLMGACAFAESYFTEGPYKTRVHGSDKDQAEVILDAIREKILAFHPELTRNGDVVDERHKIKFKNGPIIINEATEYLGATGKRADRIIFEELHCCVKDSDRQLWNVLDTKGNTRIVVNTNAGAKRQGLCWEVKNDLKLKFDNGAKNVFYFSAESDPWLPSWLDPIDVMMRSSVPEAVKRRFHLCQWGEGGDVFTEEQIIACMRKKDFRYLDALPDIPVSFALDYGPKWNWTALSGCFGRSDGVYKVHKKIWVPRGDVIQVEDVENYIEELIAPNFNMSRLDIETYQMVSTIQKLKRVLGENVVNEWTPTEQSVIAISKNIFQLVSNYRFFFPAYDEEFANELRNAELAPASGRNGTQKDDYKIMFRDLGSAGHGDDFRATAIAAFYCTQVLQLSASEVLGMVSTSRMADNFGSGEDRVSGGGTKESFFNFGGDDFNSIGNERDNDYDDEGEDE